jgi:hypothetical protein
MRLDGVGYLRNLVCWFTMLKRIIYVLNMIDKLILTTDYSNLRLRYYFVEKEATVSKVIDYR